MAQPDTFGRYRVIRHLGSGSFATVWLAHDDRLDTPVAVKVLAENWTHQLDIHQRFLEEARILRQADSAWLVRVHDIGTLPDDRPYFVMPYADQGSVADLIARKRLQLDEALRLLTEIGQGVTVLHRHGTIHRDIKPSNVLLQSSPVGQRVLVADLGFAKAIDGASGFTQAAGTPGYMSPEQGSPAGDLDVRADVYSLGAVAYELLTGRRPPQPPVRVPPSRLRPGLPRELDALIMSALSADRGQRPPDAKAFTDRIRAIRMSPGSRRRTWASRLRPVGRRTAAVAAAVTALAFGTTAAAGSPGLEFTAVRAAAGDLHLAVPGAWAQQFHSGLSPGVDGEPDAVDDGLLVATDIDAWGDGDGAVSGVFAALLPRERGAGGADGLTPTVGAVPCAGRVERRTFADRRWRGEVWYWPDCGGALTMAALRSTTADRTLYLEVRQPDRRPEVVNRIIAGTRLV
ncbi:serine/threonine-protein kinase [Nocardiopsis sediminis]|uniref:non-specific serine/threonine protein kinase n=1 Tax=Nocardiopsis sediminis TaxID=1778267 RepID=A0ABV8FP55_9ACTN